jgi:hypothetical protein
VQRLGAFSHHAVAVLCPRLPAADRSGFRPGPAATVDFVAFSPDASLPRTCQTDLSCSCASPFQLLPMSLYPTMLWHKSQPSLHCVHVALLRRPVRSLLWLAQNGIMRVKTVQPVIEQVRPLAGEITINVLLVTVGPDYRLHLPAVEQGRSRDPDPSPPQQIFPWRQLAEAADPLPGSAD